MRRDQLEHAIRAACAILETDEVIIVGSQSVLGTWDEAALPARATQSNEADILSTSTNNERVAELADRLEGAAGELSHFHRTHGFYLDGVDLTTSILPEYWRDRLVPIRCSNTNFCTGWCLEPHDLCVAKLVAHRDKDVDFVAALIEHQLIDPQIIMRRIHDIPPGYSEPAARARAWLAEYGTT